MKKNIIIKIAAVIILITAIVYVVQSLKSNKTGYAPNIQNPLIGSVVTIPIGLTQYSDESYNSVESVPDMKGKLLILIDSAFCAPCMLDYLYNFVGVDSYATDSLGLDNAVYVIISPKRRDVSFFKSELSNCSFPFIVFVDGDSQFYKANPLLQGMSDGLFAGMIPIYLLDTEGKIQTIWYSSEKQTTEGILKQGKAFLNMIRDDHSKNRIMP